jgi:hypothetical protein
MGDVLLRPQTRERLLEEEGAWVPKGRREDRSPKWRARLRKHRKLKRQAQKQGIELDTLLLRRKGDRRWDRLQQALGEQTIWVGSHPYRYAVEILECFKDRRPYSTYSYTQKRMVTKYESHRVVRVRVLGLTRIRGTHAPSPPPLPVGHEALVSPRNLDVWRLDSGYPVEAKPLPVLVAEKITYCQGIIDRDQRLLNHADSLAARGGESSQVLTWAKLGVQSWTEAREGWERFGATLQRMGHLDPTDPRVVLLLQAVEAHPGCTQSQLWNETLHQQFDGSGNGRFNFSYVERMMPRLQRWNYIHKQKGHQLTLTPRGRALLATR